MLPSLPPVSKTSPASGPAEKSVAPASPRSSVIARLHRPVDGSTPPTQVKVPVAGS